jgi:hypothetical protein
MELDIFEFIQIWYNQKRRLFALDYKTIEESWRQKNNFKNLALKNKGVYLHIQPLVFKSKIINVRVKDNICSTPSRLKKLRH